LAGNSLQANQIAIQVVGQNIANDNTPGYIQENVDLQPGPTQKVGNLLLGSGVQVKGVQQQLDTFLEARLRDAMSDESNTSTQSSTYTQLEQIVNALGSTNLGTAMTNFFSSIAQVLNSPQDVSTQNQVVLQGQTLTNTINSMAQQINSLRGNLNQQVAGMAGQINQLTGEIASLNGQIADVQNGVGGQSDAGGLQDQRLNDLESLAQLTSIQVENQADGTVNVYAGGEYLVYGSNVNQVNVTYQNSDGINAAQLQIGGSSAVLDPSSGQLAGLLASRDTALGGFLDTLDNFSQTLADEFNKVYSSGQGLTGYQQLTSENAVDAPNVALDQAGLSCTPKNGDFQFLVENTQTGLTQTSDIRVDLSGDGNDLTLNGLAAELNQVNGITASVTAGNRLSISCSSPNEQFAFSSDNSGVLAALGLNTFFTGDSASGLGVNTTLANDPSLLASSSGGIGTDTNNAATLANFANQALTSQGGNTLTDLYDNMTSDLAQASATASSSAQAAQSFNDTLTSQKASESGVNLDDQTIQLMAFQRAYQASANFIQTIQQMFQSLLQI
jgi:flagellar hook-associated protein 1 FlgK